MLEGIIFVVVLILDQVSKYLTEKLLPLGTSYPLWDGVFSFANVHNTGAAWGMLAGARWFFIAVTLVACFGMFYLLFKTRNRLGLAARICLSLLIAGAIGNLIDRVVLGYVRDMLYFSLIDFPVFNVADSAVCIGAGLLVIDTLWVKNGSLFDVMEAVFEKKKNESIASSETAACDEEAHSEETESTVRETSVNAAEETPSKQQEQE